MANKEIGATPAIINKISTTIDGGARIQLDLPPSSVEIITRLLRLKLENQPMLQLGIVSMEIE